MSFAENLDFFILPIETRPWFEQQIVLDENIFFLRGRWNENFHFFSLDLLTEDEEPLFFGKKLVPFVDFLSKLTNPLRPKGSLFFIGSKRQIETPQRNQIPSDYRLMYVRESQNGLMNAS